MPIAFHQHTCANGLTLAMESNDQAHTTAIGFFVRAGARDEDPALMGVSHFLEHMMFKGTQRRTAEDVNREFDEIGANYNAFTSSDMTAYYAHVLPEQMDRAIDLWTDLLRPQLRDDDFNMEKNVILEEIGMYEDRPVFRLQDALNALYFRDHGMGLRVLGTQQTIADMTATAMRGYFEERYSPDNMVVSVAGRFDPQQVIDAIESRTSHWQPTGVMRRYDAVTPVQTAETLRDEKLNQHYVGMLWNGPDVQSESRYAASLYGEIVGDSTGSRLYWALVDNGLAEEASLSFVPHDRLGCFMAFAACEPAQGQKVEAMLHKTVLEATDALDDDEVIRARNKIATSATRSGEQPMGRMMSVGGGWFYLNRYRPLDEEIQRLAGVTTEDVRALARAYPCEHVATVRLTPAGDQEQEA